MKERSNDKKVKRLYSFIEQKLVPIGFLSLEITCIWNLRDQFQDHIDRIPINHGCQRTLTF